MSEVPLYGLLGLDVVRGFGGWGLGAGGSYLRRIDFVYHSTLDLRVIKKKKVES